VDDIGALLQEVVVVAKEVGADLSRRRRRCGSHGAGNPRSASAGREPGRGGRDLLEKEPIETITSTPAGRGPLRPPVASSRRRRRRWRRRSETTTQRRRRRRRRRTRRCEGKAEAATRGGGARGEAEAEAAAREGEGGGDAGGGG
jgi:hypothetical protein